MPSRACESVQHALSSLEDNVSSLEDNVPPQLREHLQHCPECAQMQALLERLRRTDLHPEPSDADFLALRRSVLRDIRCRQPNPLGWLKRWAALSRRPSFALSSAGLLAVLGFLAGRSFGIQPPRAAAPSQAASENELVRQIRLAAHQDQGRQEAERAAYRYENVWMEDRADGQVALRFDATCQVAVSLPKNDPLVSDVLAQALASASPAGAKLRAIDCAGATLDAPVRRGLIQVMLSDTNLGVRLKAQSKLMEQDGYPEIQAAMLRVLQNEESVQMRLVAIDHLTRHRISPDALRQALAPAERRDAVHLKAMTYLNEQGGTL